MFENNNEVQNRWTINVKLDPGGFYEVGAFEDDGWKCESYIAFDYGLCEFLTVFLSYIVSQWVVGREYYVILTMVAKTKMLFETILSFLIIPFSQVFLATLIRKCFFGKR